MATKQEKAAWRRYCLTECEYFRRLCSRLQGPSGYTRFCCYSPARGGPDPDPANWREQDSAFYSDAGNCPLDRWRSLPPMDFEAERERIRLQNYAGIRAAPMGKRIHQRLVRGLLEGLPLRAVHDKIVAAVGSQELYLWLIVDILGDLERAGIAPPNSRLEVLRNGADAILKAQWGGNDAAYEALRDCVESGACTRSEAEAIAQELGVTEPT